MFKLVFGVTKQFHSTECFFKKQITKTGCAECHGTARWGHMRDCELQRTLLGDLRTPAKGLLNY